jgi:hypothetical protein
MYRVVTTLVCVGLLCLASGPLAGASVLDEARRESWSTEALDSLRAFFADPAVVDKFVGAVQRQRRPEMMSDLSEFGPDLCESELADLNQDGTVELVATLKDYGRFCNHIVVVARVRGAFTFDDLKVVPEIDSLKYRIVDLNRDGVKELRVPSQLADAEFGTDPRPIIDDIHTWDGAKLRQVNASFKDYYRRLLPHLEAKLEAVRQGRTRVVDPREKALLEAAHAREIEEVQRILVTE